jgi:FAD/FMN-containing dehydrogenase
MQPTLIESTWTDLQGQVRGRVIVPGDPAYDEARLAWNRKVEQHPVAIMEAVDAQDVAAAMTYARRHGVGVAVQGTGHGTVRPADASLLILTRAMSGVTVDPATRTATAEAGVKWGAVLAATQDARTCTAARLVVHGGRDRLHAWRWLGMAGPEVRPLGG